MTIETLNTAKAIAQIIFDQGIRLKSGEAGALLKVEGRKLKNQIVSLYRIAMNDDVEVTINLRQLPDVFHNTHQLIYNNLFEQIERGHIADDIDYELFSLQMQERRDQRDTAIIDRAESRAA